MGGFKQSTNHLIVSILLVSFFIFVFSGFVMFNYMEVRIIGAMRSEMTLKSQIAASEIQVLFTNAKIHTEQMGINPLIESYLARVKNRDQIKTDSDYPKVVSLLREIEALDRNIDAVWVANRSADFFFDSNGNMSDELYDVEKRPWYSLPAGSKAVEFIPPYIEYSTKRLMLSSVISLRDFDDAIYGFVGVDVALDTLPSVMETMKLTERDMGILITDGGEYIYNSRSGMDNVASIKDERDPLSSYSGMILLERSGFKEIKYGSKDAYLYFKPVADTGWLLVSILDTTLLESEIKQALIMIGGVLAVGYLILIAGMVLMYRRLPNTRGYEVSQTEAACYAQVAGLEKELHEKSITASMQYRHIIENEKMSSLGNLVAGVTHEVNTPISVALTASTLLNQIVASRRLKFQDGKLTKSDLEKMMEELDESIGMVVNNLTRAADLVRSFKQVAVDQSGEGKYTFNLKENIDAVSASLRHEYKNRRHVIVNDCPLDLMLDSYPGIYSQIFTNLAMNSIHHGFNGKEGGTIRIVCRNDGDKLSIVYTDDGKGIDSENLEHVFEAFFTTNRSKGNNGLGMHIIQKLIVEKLGGTIRCESQVGEGVTFTIEVPIASP